MKRDAIPAFFESPMVRLDTAFLAVLTVQDDELLKREFELKRGCANTRKRTG